MSQPARTDQKEKAAKVRRPSNQDSILTPTFAASYRATALDPSLAAATPGEMLQRQCACGTHTIAGTVCPSCREEPAGGLRDDPQPTATPDLQTARDPAAAASLVSIPATARGNRPVQASLTVNAPDDQYEQEAEQVADAVMRMPATQMEPAGPEPTGPEPTGPDPITHANETISRLPAISSLQASGQSDAAFTAPPAVETRIQKMDGAGQPLPSAEQEFFEERMGYDFARVRIHTNDNAVQASRDIQARAFTTGNNIAFDAGSYQPGTATGRRLLAHELTHVVQQGGGQETSLRRQPAPITHFRGSPFDRGNTYSQLAGTNGLLVQRIGLDDVTDFVGDVGSAVGDAVGDVVEMGADAFMAVVSQVAPQLVTLIRNGPAGMLQEALQEGIQGWLQSLLGDIDVGSVVTSLSESVAGAIGTIQGVLQGDAEACQAFAQNIQAIRDFMSAFMENPVVQQIQAAFDTVKSVLQQISSMVLSPIFDALMEVAGGIFDHVRELAGTISGWISNVRDFMSAAWDWVKEQLGLSGDSEEGIWEWLKEQAADVWQEVKTTLEPVMGPLQIVVGAILLISPAGPFIAAVTLGPPLVEAIQWLWAHKDDPNIVENAHAEMGDTILPQLLSSLQSFGEGFQAAVTALVGHVLALGEGLLNLLGAVTGIPLLSVAQNALQSISDGIQNFATWAQETLLAAGTTIREIFQKINAALQPYIEILSSIGMAILNPGMIPVMLAGWAWRALDDCYKAPIINFLLDVVIGILQSLPALPMLGLLWPIVKEAIIGFLQGVKSQDDQKKIKVTNKLAKIISGASPAFIFGFVKGLLKGIWEGLTDPFVLIYTAVQGLTNLVTWLVNTASQAMSAAQDPENEDSPDPALAERMREMGGELEPPVTQVTGGFMPAVEEFFTGGDGMTFEDLMAKLGDLWDSVSGALRDAGASLANSMFEFFLQDSAEGAIGEGVGWLAGTIIFEVVLGVLTAGTYTATSGVMRVLQTFAKILDWTSEVLGMAFRALSRLGGYVMDLLKALGRMLSNAGGAIRTVLDALKELGEKLIRFGAELLGFGARGADDVAGEAAERAGREGLEEVGEEGAERAGREGLEEAGEEGAEQTGRRADDLEGSPDFLEAKALTESNEALGTPATALLGILAAAVPGHRFEAPLIGAGQHRIVMRATLDSNYDPTGVILDADGNPTSTPEGMTIGNDMARRRGWPDPPEGYHWYGDVPSVRRNTGNPDPHLDWDPLNQVFRNRQTRDIVPHGPAPQLLDQTGQPMVRDGLINPHTGQPIRPGESPVLGPSGRPARQVDEAGQQLLDRHGFAWDETTGAWSKTTSSGKTIQATQAPDGSWTVRNIDDGKTIAEFSVAPYRSGTPSSGADDFFQAHHAVQDAWANRRLQAHGYSHNDVPTIVLRDSFNDSPHRLITNRQAGRAGDIDTRTFIQERENMIADLRSVGVPEAAITETLRQTDAYYRRLWDSIGDANVRNSIFGDCASRLGW